VDLDDGEVFGDTEDDRRQCLEDVAQTHGETLMRQFVANLDQLRHYKAGEQEIDLVGHIKNDPIGHATGQRTGRTVEELLTRCSLYIGDPQYLDSWPLTDYDGVVKAEDDWLVRLLLSFAWQVFTLPNQDEETNRALDTVASARKDFYASEKLNAQKRELAAQQEKLAAEQARRSAGGRAAAVSEERSANREAVVREWASLSNRPKRDRAAIIAERLGIAAGQVRRHARKAGLR
jgi:hypothetical protein